MDKYKYHHRREDIYIKYGRRVLVTILNTFEFGRRKY
jgi:hypothetical protein